MWGQLMQMGPLQTKALRKLWMSVSAEDSQHMIDMLDADRDNRISIDEFRRFVYLLPESLVSLSHPGRPHMESSPSGENHSPVSGWDVRQVHFSR